MTLRAFVDRHLSAGSPGWRKKCFDVLRFVITVLEHVDHDRVAIRASGLAYTTLLAIVPLVAVVISLFSAIRAFEAIKEKVRTFLISQFVAARHTEVELWIDRFTDGASRLGVLGFLILVVTCVLLLSAIETNFNQIWRVAQRRTWFSRVTTYTAVLVLGSLLLGASLTLTARLQAVMALGPFDPGIIDWFNAWILPFVLSVLAFLVAYQAFPNASVAFRSALLGAVVGATLFELGKLVFARTTGASVNLSILYGSLAALPIFLIWLYYTWIIVLVGLEVAYTHQYKGARSRPSLEQEGLSGFRTCLRIFLAIAARFQSGKAPPTTEELSQEVGYPSDRIAFALRTLANADLIHRVGIGRQHRAAWVPASSPDRTKLSSVMKKLAFSDNGESSVPADTTGLGIFLAAGARALEQRTVADEIEQIASSSPANGSSVV